MANYLINLISEISGFPNFQKCLEICDILDFNGLLSIDENTLDRMEIFLQKKCSRMPLNERNKFIGDRFVKNPGIFKFSPATRQRILNVIKNLEKIFTNPLLPISINSISELCNKLLTSNTASISSIPVNSIEVVLKQNYLVNPFENNVSLSSITSPNDDVSQSDISESKSFSESTKNGTKADYSNIFQKMDSLRENFSKLSEKPDTNSDGDSQVATKEAFPFQKLEIPDSDINKENISHKPVIKRPVDIDSEKDEPAKKIRRVSNRLLNELSSQPEKMIPERLRSQRLLNKNKLNKTTELLEMKYSSNGTNITNISDINVSGEIQDNGQLSSNKCNTLETITVNMKEKEANTEQNKSILSEGDKPDLLNNLPQTSNFLEDSGNIVLSALHKQKIDNSDNVINKPKQKSKNFSKSRKSSPKASHPTDSMVVDSAKTSNISKQLSKFKETTINASGSKHTNRRGAGNVISSVGSKEINFTPSQSLKQAYNGMHKPIKTSSNSNNLDKNSSKDKQQKFLKSPDSVSNDRMLSNSTNSEFDITTNSTVSTPKLTKISDRDETKNSFTQLHFTTNGISKFNSRTWQPPKISPLFKEVAKSSEIHATVSHPIPGQGLSVISKSPPSQNIQIYIEPDLPKPDLNKSNVPQRVQLSDVPFQCFDTPALSKKPSNIRIKRPTQSSKPPKQSVTKLAPCRYQSDIDAEPSAESSVNNVHTNINKTTVKPIAISRINIKQKSPENIMSGNSVAKKSEKIQDSVEKISVSSNFKKNAQANMRNATENSNNNISQSIITALALDNGVTKEVSDLEKETSTDHVPLTTNSINNNSLDTSIDVKPIVTNQINTQQNTNEKVMPFELVAKGSETNQGLVESILISTNNDKTNVSQAFSNHITQSIIAVPSVENLPTKEVTDSEKEKSTRQLPFTPEPSWISKPSFITNRFINSTKHIRAVLLNGIKSESKLPTDSEHPSNS